MASDLLVPRDHLKAGPATEAEYIAAVVRRAARFGRSAVEDTRAITAYVNHGRWIADCPHCGSGIAIHPEWSVAACMGMGCYRIYRAVDVPGEWRHIEGVLSQRQRRNQHWTPAESLEALASENVRHGVPTGIGRDTR